MSHYAFCFSFLPDGRIIVGERQGRIRIVERDGKLGAPIESLPSNLYARGLFEVRPDRAFANNRTLYLTYAAIPDGDTSARDVDDPGGIGINSVDWPQPQQLDSNMGKVLRINPDGSIPKDNPFAGRAGAHSEIDVPVSAASASARGATRGGREDSRRRER